MWEHMADGRGERRSEVCVECFLRVLILVNLY